MLITVLDNKAPIPNSELVQPSLQTRTKFILEVTLKMLLIRWGYVPRSVLLARLLSVSACSTSSHTFASADKIALYGDGLVAEGRLGQVASRYFALASY